MRIVKSLLALSCMALMINACDCDVHYVKAAPVEPVEQGDLQ